VAISLVAVSGKAGTTTVDTGDGVLAVPQPDKTLVAVDRDVTISWQVKTSDGDILFRLYRGPNSHTLELVTEEPATPGVQRYEYREVLDLFGPVWYELRFVTPSGHEIALASVLYLVPTMEPGPEEVVWSSSSDQAMVTEPPEVPGPRSQRRIESNTPVDTGFIPEPARPPPKRSDSPHASV
jgi:hypothetical protein